MNRKHLSARLLAAAMLFLIGVYGGKTAGVLSVNASAEENDTVQEAAAPGQYEASGVPAGAEETGTALTSGEIPSDEYERAVWYGFLPQGLALGADKPATWGEYCTMIGNMLERKGETLGAQWKELAALALHSEQEMVRDQGCFVLYRAAELMGEDQNDGGLRAVSTNPHLLPSNDGSLYSWDYRVFTGEGNDEWIQDDTYEGLFGQMSYITAAVMFCQFRISLCSFETLYDTQTDITDPLTVREAALSVLRLYECTPDAAKAFWLDRIEKLDEKVLSAGEPEEVTALREQILHTESGIVRSDVQIPGQTYTGTAYYVSSSGSDDNDGLSPETAWATLDKINQTPLFYGDAVFFERGGTYRGNLYLYDTDGYVTLSAYGEGEKPVLTSAGECAAGAEKWSLWYEEDGVRIWKYYKDCLDCGLIVFDDARAGYKVVADWSGTEWINRDGTPFDIAASLTEDLDFFSDDGGRFGGAADFYVGPGGSPEDVKYGPLYLRCDEGNPGEVFGCVELCTMTAPDERDGAYEGTVADGIDGSVYDNLSIKYFPMGGVCIGGRDNIIQNCEIAWGGGCVQYMENGKITGQMGDAINGCGLENCRLTGNYIHDIVSSPLIVESWRDVQIRDISVSRNLIERTGGGININDNENISFENVSVNDNVFYLVSASWPGERLVRSGLIAAGEWTACFRIRDPYEYTNCTFSGNAMYDPLMLFYYCDVPLPQMSDNLYVPSEYTAAFANIKYNEETGPYIPARMEEAEHIVRDVFGDSTSEIKNE